MKAETTPNTHRRTRHAARNVHRTPTGRAEALVLAFLTLMLRRLLRSLRSTLTQSREDVVWQLRRRERRRAAEERERERAARRRRIALVTTGVAITAALTTARALAHR
jgi:hypothetical protein